MSSGSACEKCQAPVSDNMKICRKCEGKKFVGAAKSLFGHLFNDAKNVVAKVKKVRVQDGNK